LSGSVSCRRETAGAGTSKASTTTRAEVAWAFIWPVTSIVKVWLALVRPFTVNIVTRISSVPEYVSTSATKAPSTDTRAIPAWVPRAPIQVTEGPVKVNVACAPGVVETAAVPALHDLLASDAHPEVKVTDESVSSKRTALDTVTVTAKEVARLPAASRATAVRICEPLATAVVFQDTEYGAAVSSAPSAAPSNRNWTPATPTLSEASALTLIVPDTVAPFAGAVIDTVGGVVSLNTVTVTELEVYWRPSRSLATAVKVCEPLLAAVVSHETEYGALVSSAPRLAPSRLNWTPATTRDPTMLTLALTGTAPATVDPEAGEVIVTTKLPGRDNNCAKTRGEVQAAPSINRRTAAQARLAIFIMAPNGRLSGDARCASYGADATPIGSSHGTTSKASTWIQKFAEAMFLSITWIVSVWVPAAKPVAVKSV